MFSLQVCSLLLAHGADPTLLNCHSKSAIDVAPSRELQERLTCKCCCGCVSVSSKVVFMLLLVLEVFLVHFFSYLLHFLYIYIFYHWWYRLDTDAQINEWNLDPTHHLSQTSTRATVCWRRVARLMLPDSRNSSPLKWSTSSIRTLATLHLWVPPLCVCLGGVHGGPHILTCLGTCSVTQI